MQKERFSDKELTVELRMSLKSKQRAYRKNEVSMNWSVFSIAVAPGYIWSHLDTSD